jgi:hypothetical protein
MNQVLINIISSIFEHTKQKLHRLNQLEQENSKLTILNTYIFSSTKDVVSSEDSEWMMKYPVPSFNLQQLSLCNNARMNSWFCSKRRANQNAIQNREQWSMRRTSRSVDAYRFFISHLAGVRSPISQTTSEHDNRWYEQCGRDLQPLFYFWISFF